MNNFLVLCLIFSIRKVQSIAISEPSKMAKMKLREAALNVANMRLSEECTRLRCDYKQYEINPFSHPMYAKEWRIFYCQTLSQLAAGNLTYLYVKNFDSPTQSNSDFHFITVQQTRIPVNMISRTIGTNTGRNVPRFILKTVYLKSLQILQKISNSQLPVQIPAINHQMTKCIDPANQLVRLVSVTSIQ